MDDLELRLNPRMIDIGPNEFARTEAGAVDAHVTIRLHNLTADEVKVLGGHTLSGTEREVQSRCAALPEVAEAVRRTIERARRETYRVKHSGGELRLGERTLVMGILNVTPDSFFDGGRWNEPAAAVEHGLKLWKQGADIIDVGGESTRPGSEPVSEEEERRRVVPVIERLAAEGVLVSVDTSKAAVAEAALRAGARIVNDITGLADPKCAKIAAQFGAAVVIMHIKGTPKTMQENPEYDDLMAEITGALRRRVKESGIAEDRIILDPGIGFGKRPEHNVEILRRLREFRSLGFPVLVGTSRKSFIGHLLGGRPVGERLIGTLATVCASVANGADIVRVHDVAEAVDAVRIADALKGSRAW